MCEVGLGLAQLNEKICGLGIGQARVVRLKNRIRRYILNDLEREIRASQFLSTRKRGKRGPLLRWVSLFGLCLTSPRTASGPQSSPKHPELPHHPHEASSVIYSHNFVPRLLPLIPFFAHLFPPNVCFWSPEWIMEKPHRSSGLWCQHWSRKNSSVNSARCTLQPRYCPYT